MGTLVRLIRRFLLMLSIRLHRVLAFFGVAESLHKARLALPHELASLFQLEPPGRSLLLGVQLFKHFLLVSPTPARRELGNLLIVAPTRGGKGLLAVSQLLSWNKSAVVNDVKGELYQATAGYRSTLGKVYVIDPRGVGNRFDPLFGKNSEDELFSSAARLLFHSNEGEGKIFTDRAITMLTQLFLAAVIEDIPPLPYARQMIRLGIVDAAARLNGLSPELAAQFLDTRFTEASFTDRFLLSAWGTLTARLRPILTETVIRSLAGSDLTPAELMHSQTPVTVYFRWPEKDLLALSPLVRLLWGALIDELITSFDNAEGKGCQPVLLLIDEAGRTAIPSLADHATTVVGRGISLWIAIQSLSQLEVVYGKSRAQVLRDNMESQLYYRPTDLATAEYLEDRLGRVSAYAHSQTLRDGTETAEGRHEQGIPLLTAQEIMQLSDEEIIGFHRNLPPFRLERVDWRHHSFLKSRFHLSPPPLAPLPQIADISTFPLNQHLKQNAFIDPDRSVN